jgi:hypothetical protein
MVLRAPVDEIVIYSGGLVHISVCAPADMSRAEVERQAESRHWSGTRGWKIDSGSFLDGTPNPCVCELDPGRVHYLLSC